ncbi:hypothetical protein ACIA49_05120 [Kribbella sp. NPDC051587]|uniref:hypothetical protein n=1 Tax=Kribbella sp. NPDC051587 TaxID=3364119 RepID=UPI00379C6AC8
MKRTATRLATLTAATATAMVLATAPSFAYPTTATATTAAGYGYFNGETQVIAVHDSHKDGQGVAILYYRYDLAKTGPYYAWNQQGNGTTTYLYLNMPSNTTIKMYACPEKEGIVINSQCGSGVFATVPI